jgi:hypothetical protein
MEPTMSKRESKLTADVKTIVTVRAVRAANGKLMTAGKVANPVPAPVASTRVTSALRDVAVGGQRAMASLKKA